MPIKSTYARVDVQGSRANLRKRVEAGERVPFSISGYLVSAENDDGTSQEFAADVTDFAIDGKV